MRLARFVLSARDGGRRLSDQPVPAAAAAGTLPRLAVHTAT